MEDWQKRVVKEQADLQEKLNALVKFTTSEGFADFSREEQEEFVQQAHHMNAYNEILKSRIGKFE